MNAVLVAKCENYREVLDEQCNGELRFEYGAQQAACTTCGGWCGISVALWDRVETGPAPS